MHSLNQRVNEAIQLMDQTSTLFYRQKNQEGYQLMDRALQSLMQTMLEINVLKSQKDNNMIDENKLNNILGRSMSAIEKKDMILLSDLFTFELKPLFEEFNRNL